jgi:hypothetical protein
MYEHWVFSESKSGRWYIYLQGAEQPLIPTVKIPAAIMRRRGPKSNLLISRARLMTAAPIGDELADIVLEVYQRTECPTVADFQRMVKKASELKAKREGRT